MLSGVCLQGLGNDSMSDLQELGGPEVVSLSLVTDLFLGVCRQLILRGALTLSNRLKNIT